MNRRCDKILVCSGTGCVAGKSLDILGNFQKELADCGRTDVKVSRTGCFGLCSAGPIVITQPDNCSYALVGPDDVPEIVSEHIVGGKPVERLLYKNAAGEAIPLFDDDFYKKQQRICRLICHRGHIFNYCPITSNYYS